MSVDLYVLLKNIFFLKTNFKLASSTFFTADDSMALSELCRKYLCLSGVYKKETGFNSLFYFINN